MRMMIIAFTAIVLAPTAVSASAAGRELTADTNLVRPVAQINQLALVGTTFGQLGGSGDHVILVKGDQSGNGPGAGGHKGQKKGGHHGKQENGKDNPNRGKGKGKT